MSECSELGHDPTKALSCEAFALGVRYDQDRKSRPLKNPPAHRAASLSAIGGANWLSHSESDMSSNLLAGLGTAFLASTR